MLRELRPALVLIGLFTVITGLIYPLAVTGLAHVLFPAQANGSLVVVDGKIVGSSLVGQAFNQDGYFQGRPSATADSPYNAASSGGSNLGPTSRTLIQRVKGEVERRHKENPDATVPTDLVTASGSGLDPHISPAAAFFQVPRVAKACNMPEDRVHRLVSQHIEGRVLGILGEPRVNVLALNMALDRAARP